MMTSDILFHFSSWMEFSLDTGWRLFDTYLVGYGLSTLSYRTHVQSNGFTVHVGLVCCSIDDYVPQES